jgi:prepilin-type N-terminal cleavage/methylation domain-containing protein
MRQRRRPTPKTSGFTLVEVLVSLTLLSVASLALGSMLFRATREAGAASTGSYQTAMVSGEVSRLGATPYDQLAPGTTTFTRTISGNGNPLKTE